MRATPPARHGVTARVVALLAALLAACGGGGSSSTPSPAPGLALLRLSGVAATGAALAGATVQARCVTGSGQATTATDGSYSMDVANATLPCVLSATAAGGGTQLRSLASPANGATQVVHLNPVTELAVAQLAGQHAGAFFQGFDASAAARVTASAMGTATTAVAALLRDAGVDIGAIGDPFTAPLVAAHGSVTGNGYDQALDALAATLNQAGTTLPQLATQVAQAAPSAPASTTAAPALPPNMLLRRAHASCASLRSGTYRIITPSNPTQPARLINVDAPRATFTWADGTTNTHRSLGGCTFEDTARPARWVVTPAGVMVGSNDGPAIAFPEQATTLADWAGSWNWAEWFEVQPAVRALDMGIVDIDATGQITRGQECRMLEPCVTNTGPVPTLRTHPDGGLEVLSGGPTRRLFLYRPAGGAGMGVMVGSDGLMFMSRVTPQSLPALNDSWHRLDLGIDQQLRTAGFTFSSYRAAAVDSAAGSYTRLRVQDGGSQVFRFNFPRTGVIHRAPGTTVLNTGTTVNYTELYVLPLGTTGVLAYGRQTADNQRNLGVFGLAIAVPPEAAAAAGVTPPTGGGGGGGGGSGPTATALNFNPTPPARLVVDFSEPMDPTYFTTGAYVPTSSVWETPTRFVITFSSYTPGGVITLKAPTAGNTAGFRSAAGTPMAADVNFQFP